MAAASRKQVDALNTAVQKLATRFNVNDPCLLLEALASLAGHGICGRCLMRAAGHMNMDDYALPSTSQSELMSWLKKGTGDSGSGCIPSAEGTPPPVRAPSQAADAGAEAVEPAAAAAAAAPICPACFGLLSALLEDQLQPSQMYNEAIPSVAIDGNQLATAPLAGDAASASGRAPPEVAAGERGPAPPATAALPSAAESSGASAVDLGWLRVQQRAFPGVVGGHTGPALGHERLQGWPAAAGLAAAIQRQAEEGPPETAELAAAAAAAATAAASTVTITAGGDVMITEKASDVAASAVEGSAGPAPAAATELQLSPPLTMKSFSLEVGSVPGAAAVRDVAMHAWLSAFWESRGVKCTAWRPTDFVPLPMVLRRVLPISMSRQLVLPTAAPQASSVHVSVVVVDNEGGLEELRVLADHQLATRRSRYNNKRQRGLGRSQEEQGSRGGGGGGGGGRGGGSGRGGGGAEQDAEVHASQESERSMSYEQALNATCSMPRATLTSIFPWPPLSWAQRRERRGQEAAPNVNVAAAEMPCVYVRAVHKPLLLAGRYCKLRRHMPQSPWFVLGTGARIGGTSVQEAIEEFVLPLYGTGTAKMVTGGREDADVRMLGAGRPFILELQAPLRNHPPAEALRHLEQRMRDSKCGVSVQDLTPCGPDALEAIKLAEEHKEKTYRALCWAERAPTAEDLASLVAMGRVEVAQDTPVRVLHRRAAKIRTKWLVVESATAVPGQPHYFVLQLRTQAGAYVKEFCHGDFGRCQPSLGDLLGQIQRRRADIPADTVAATTTTATATTSATATAADVDCNDADDKIPAAASLTAMPLSVDVTITTPTGDCNTEAAATEATAKQRKFSPKHKPRPNPTNSNSKANDDQPAQSDDYLRSSEALRTAKMATETEKEGINLGGTDSAPESASAVGPPSPPPSPVRTVTVAAVAAARSHLPLSTSVVIITPESGDIGDSGSGGGGGGGGCGGGGGGGGAFVRVEILQLDVLDVHLEHWP